MNQFRIKRRLDVIPRSQNTGNLLTGSLLGYVAVMVHGEDGKIREATMEEKEQIFSQVTREKPAK